MPEVLQHESSSEPGRTSSSWGSAGPHFPQEDAVWSVVQNVYEPDRIHHDETIFTVGNGYLCTRGSTEEAGG